MTKPEHQHRVTVPMGGYTALGMEPIVLPDEVKGLTLAEFMNRSIVLRKQAKMRLVAEKMCQITSKSLGLS